MTINVAKYEILNILLLEWVTKVWYEHVQQAKYNYVFTDISKQQICPKHVGFYPEILNGGGNSGMNILLSTKLPCNASIVALEMYRILAAETDWMEVLRPVAGEPGERYKVVHRTFVSAVSEDGIQKINLGLGLSVEPGDVLASRPSGSYQFIDNAYDSNRLDWANKYCLVHQRPANDGSPTDITPCRLLYRKYALRGILN